MQRKKMTPEKVEQEMREMFARISSPEVQKRLDEEEKNSKFRLKLLGRDDLDYEEEKARERMNKEKK